MFSLLNILYTLARVQQSWLANHVTECPCSRSLCSINFPTCITNNIKGVTIQYSSVLRLPPSDLPTTSMNSPRLTSVNLQTPVLVGLNDWRYSRTKNKSQKLKLKRIKVNGIAIQHPCSIHCCALHKAKVVKLFGMPQTFP